MERITTVQYVFQISRRLYVCITIVAAFQLRSVSICPVVVNVVFLNTQNSPEEEAELKKLKDLEKSVEQIANKLDEINKELTGIQKVCQFCILLYLCTTVLQVYVLKK